MGRFFLLHSERNTNIILKCKEAINQENYTKACKLAFLKLSRADKGNELHVHSFEVIISSM
jgi:hypothetical protein